MKLSRSHKITLNLIIWTFLFYFLFFEFYFEKTPFICAVCRGEISTTNFYLLNCNIFESESKINNIDEIYQKYVNEKHSHIWIKNGFCERSSVFGKKCYVDRYSMLQPSFSSVYIFNTSLKMIKENLRKGNLKDLLKQYHENIEQIKLNNMNLEAELRAKNKEISDLLKNTE
ncbi:MAG: hypothetical protein WA705_05560 [Candidatus Ozemobacteraceae bacterium]